MNNLTPRRPFSCMDSDPYSERPDDSPDADEVEKAKSKLILDFGLEQKAPEHVTLEVLRELIRKKPERMTQVVRKWLHPDDST